MLAYHVGGGAHAWVLSAHGHAASFFSSLMSVCGLIAICVLLCFINASTNGEEDASSHRDVVTKYILKTNDIPQEEVTFCAFLLASLPKTNSQRTREQVGALINLLISFGLGLMILIVLSALTLICYPRRGDSEAETIEERRAARGFRLLSLGLMLRRYHVRLQTEDACEKKTEAGQPSTVWLIPEPGVPNDEQADGPRRKVADRCAICLEEYKVGDKVSYSSNANCLHVFHEPCCSSWMLSSSMSTNQQCPVCRQTFLSMQDCPDVKKTIY